MSFNLFWCISFRKAQHMDLQKNILIRYAHAADPVYFFRRNSLRHQTFETPFCRFYRVPNPWDPGLGGNPWGTQGDPRAPSAPLGGGGGGDPRTLSSPRNLPPSWVGAQNVPWKGVLPQNPQLPPLPGDILGANPTWGKISGGSWGVLG